MRSYIFTPLERRILEGWLRGEVDSRDVRLRKVLSRVRLFRRLAEDVELYLAVRRRLTEPKPA